METRFSSRRGFLLRQRLRQRQRLFGRCDRLFWGGAIVVFWEVRSSFLGRRSCAGKLVKMRSSQLDKCDRLRYNQIIYHTISIMVEWDGKKAKGNLIKHGISFIEAISVLDDPYVLILDDHFTRLENFDSWLSVTPNRTIFSPSSTLNAIMIFESSAPVPSPDKREKYMSKIFNPQSLLQDGEMLAEYDLSNAVR